MKTGAAVASVAQTCKMNTLCLPRRPASRQPAVWLLLLLLAVTIAILYWNRVPTDKRRFEKVSPSKYRQTSNAGSDEAFDLMIFSYMRAGSTLTGELFRDINESFYVFEPLNTLAPYHYFMEDRVCKMRNQICHKENASTRLREAYDVIENLYNCNIGSTEHAIVEWIKGENKSGHPWTEYSNCNLSKSVCLQNIEQRCRDSEFRVTKVLRLSFDLVKPLLLKFPRLKILFLVRDPRAILNSRLKTDWFPVFEDDMLTVRDNVHSLCTKMAYDLSVMTLFRGQFPDRILPVRIEDLVANGYAQVQSITRFINIPFSKQIERHLDENNVKNLGFTSLWKQEIPWSVVKMVDKHCKVVYDMFGYVTFPTESSMRASH